MRKAKIKLFILSTVLLGTAIIVLSNTAITTKKSKFGENYHEDTERVHNFI